VTLYLRVRIANSSKAQRHRKANASLPSISVVESNLLSNPEIRSSIMDGFLQMKDSSSRIPSASNATPASASTSRSSSQTAKPAPRKPVILQPNGLAVPSITHFDPWNSASTGHQRAENRLAGSTSWAQSRNLRLGVQYKGGLSGGGRVGDTVGPGSEGFGNDGRKANGAWVKGAKGLRTDGQLSIWEAVDSKSQRYNHGGKATEAQRQEDEDFSTSPDSNAQDRDQPLSTALGSHQKPLFSSLTFYINGTTAPLISDLKLKRLIAQHSGRLSIGLGRRSVTHVILGNTYAKGGAGGGLAATKIQKEIQRVGGKGVKFVSADWVVECVRLGKRVPEAGFAKFSTAPYGQRSVLDTFRTTKVKDGTECGKDKG
jgi:BRCT domain, a BRCA1 C-terminus domain